MKHDGIEVKIEDIKNTAERHGWEFLTYQKDIYMLSFSKEDMRINVYVTKMTVATCIDHPKQGKTQMFRKNVNKFMLNRIFKNPRIHTDKGYQKK